MDWYNHRFQNLNFQKIRVIILGILCIAIVYAMLLVLPLGRHYISFDIDPILLQQVSESGTSNPTYRNDGQFMHMLDVGTDTEFFITEILPDENLEHFIQEVSASEELEIAIEE